MRVLNIASGISVLLVTLAFAHIIHHHVVNAAPEDVKTPIFFAGVAVGVVVGGLALIGGCLLIRRAR